MQDKVKGTNVELRLSPPTRFTIDAVLDLLAHEQNVLLETSSSDYLSLLFIAYEYSSKNSSTTEIVSDLDLKQLNIEYYLLQQDSLPLYFSCPICIKRKDVVEIEPYLLRTAAKQKKVLKESLKISLQNSEKPRIILCNEHVLSSNSDNVISNFDTRRISLIIILGFDYRSFDQFQSFIDRFRSNDQQFVIVSSHIPNNIFQKIESIEDVSIISLNREILCSNDKVKAASLRYYNSEQFIRTSDYVSAFNLDQQSIYADVEPIIEVICADVGEIIPGQIARIGFLISKIGKVPFKLEIILKSIGKIAIQALSSFCPIDGIKIYSSYFGFQVDARSLSSAAESFYSELDNFQITICNGIIDSFWRIRDEIENCRNPFVTNGYSKTNKFSLLFDILNEEQSDVIVFPINSETSVLKKYVGLLNKKDQIIVENTKNITRIETSNSILILSGRPESSQSYVLNLPFRKIIILAYSGKDYEMSLQFVNDYVNGRPLVKSSLIRTIGKLSNSTAELFEKTYPEIMFSIKNDNDTDDIIINHDFDDDSDPDYSEMETEDEFDYYNFRKISRKLSMISTEDSEDVAGINAMKVTLSNVHNEDTLTKFFDRNKLFATLDTSTSSIEEKPLDTIDIGSLVIVRFSKDSNSTTLLDILMEMYDLDQEADVSIIEKWNDAVRILNNIGIEQVYTKYIELGGNKQRGTVLTWMSGRTMAPESKEDIHIIGQITQITELEEDYEYLDSEFNKIRRQKRNVGRNLFKIITDILDKNNADDLDPRSIQLKETLRDRIFIIDKIESAVQKN